MSAQFPFVKMPSAAELLMDLLESDPNLPPELIGKVVPVLDDNFPADLPWLVVRSVPGAGSRPVPQRLAEAAFDLPCYAFDHATAEDLALTIAAIAQTLVGKKTSKGGVTYVEVTEPFALPDGTTAHRWIVQVTMTDRPV